MNTETEQPNETLDTFFKAGVHYGVAKARRHPSTQKHLYGQKQAMDLFDLENTQVMLEKAKDYVRTLGRDRKLLLFVGGKPESHKIVRDAAIRTKAPYVVGRWIGGSLTNHSEIKKRVARMQDLIAKRDSGALSKYTKFEQLQIDREIEKLETMYAGLTPLNDKLPHAIFIVDPRREAIAVNEAHRFKIPVVALANSDCNLNGVDYPIPANDAAAKSIDLIVNEIASAYEEGLQEKPAEQPVRA